jgi:hypothetical protein
MADSLKMNLYGDEIYRAVERGRQITGGDPKIED